jgi:hypothetical protein
MGPPPGAEEMPGGPGMPPVLDEHGGPPDGLLPPDDAAAHPEADKKRHDDAAACWQPFYTVYGPHAYIDADYLYWRIRPMPVTAPLLTTGAVTNPPQAGFGILGNPTTSILFGQNDVDPGAFSGTRITVGGWLDGGYRSPCDRPIGLEATYLLLGRQASHFSFNSDATGSPLLARPVVDTTVGQETALLVSAPGPSGAAGSFNVNTDTELWGAEANAFVPLIGTPHLMVGGLLGVRFLNLEEGLDMAQQTNVLGNGVAFFNGLPVRAPGGVIVTDDFQTRNNFYGGQVGAQAALHFKNVSITVLGKLAMGTMEQQINITGQTTLLMAGVPTFGTPGGLLALASNSGRFNTNRFALVPEGAATVSVQLTDKIHISAGYTYLNINNVVRAGNQINRLVDPTQLPSSQTFTNTVGTQPTLNFNRSTFWAEGLTVGLGLTF